MESPYAMHFGLRNKFLQNETIVGDIYCLNLIEKTLDAHKHRLVLIIHTVA